MDGAGARDPYSAVAADQSCVCDTRLQRVGGSQWFALTVWGVGLAGAAIGADLGGSSKYSSESLEV